MDATSTDALPSEISRRIDDDQELILHRHRADGASPPLWIVQVGVPGRWDYVDIGPDAATALGRLLSSLKQSVMP